MPEAHVANRHEAATVVGIRQPSRPPRHRKAALVEHFLDIMGGALHILPDVVDVGSVTTDKSVEVVLWAASADGYDLDSVTLENGEGVEVDISDNLPIRLYPFSETPVRITVRPEGPAQINATVYFNSSDSSQPSARLIVSGSRSSILPLQPNTAGGYRERLEWVTNILKAYDGTEQRMSLKALPSHSLTVNVKVWGEAARVLDGYLWARRYRSLSIPLWHLASNLQTTALAEAQELRLPTAYTTIKTGTTFVIYEGPDHYEILDALIVDPDAIVLRRPLAQTWYAGTPVMPIAPAMLPLNVKRSWTAMGVSEGDLTFTFDAPEELHDDIKDNLCDQYLGYPVLTIAPNTRDSVSEDISVRATDITTNTGAPDYYVRSRTPDVLWDFHWWLRSRNQIALFKKWLFSIRGAALPFWVPTWKFDVVLGARYHHGQMTMELRGGSFTKFYVDDPVRSHIRLLFKTGEILYRKIRGVLPPLPEAAGERIVLSEPIQKDFGPDDLVMISFMALHRLESDTVTLDWRSQDLAEVKTVMRLLDYDV